MAFIYTSSIHSISIQYIILQTPFNQPFNAALFNRPFPIITNPSLCSCIYTFVIVISSLPPPQPKPLQHANKNGMESFLLFKLHKYQNRAALSMRRFPNSGLISNTGHLISRYGALYSTRLGGSRTESSLQTCCPHPSVANVAAWICIWIRPLSLMVGAAKLPQYSRHKQNIPSLASRFGGGSRCSLGHGFPLLCLLSGSRRRRWIAMQVAQLFQSHCVLPLQAAVVGRVRSLLSDP